MEKEEECCTGRAAHSLSSGAGVGTGEERGPGEASVRKKNTPVMGGGWGGGAGRKVNTVITTNTAGNSATQAAA